MACVEFCASRSWVCCVCVCVYIYIYIHTYSTIHIYVKLESSSNTLEPHRPRHDRPANRYRPPCSCYCSFTRWRKNSAHVSEMILFQSFTFLNCITWHCVSRGVCVCVCVCVCVHEFGAAVEHNVAEDWKALWTLQFVLTRLCSFLPRSDVIRRERDGPRFTGDCRASMPGQLFARRICVSHTDPGTYCMPGNNEDSQLSNTVSRGSGGQGSRYTLELGENYHPFVQ